MSFKWVKGFYIPNPIMPTPNPPKPVYLPPLVKCDKKVKKPHNVTKELSQVESRVRGDVGTT